MILLERIEEVDPSWLTPYAKQELDENLTVAEELYVLRADAPVLVVGLRRWSLLRAPELWIMLCKDYKPIYLRWSKRAVQELLDKYHKLQVWVRSDYPAGRRFALAHGFESERFHTIDGVEYEHMVARKK